MSYAYYGDFPRSQFSGPLVAELSRGVRTAGSPTVYARLTLVTPGGTFVYSTTGTKGSSPQIASVELPTSSIEIKSNAPSRIEIGIGLLDDEERAFAALVAKYRRTLRGSSATLVLGGPQIRSGSEFTFDGVLYSTSLMAPGEWDLRLRPNDRALQSVFLTKKVTAADWPDADASALGQVYPLIYGEHSSVGLSNKGMVPCLYVDKVGFRYMIQLGHSEGVDGVYGDGAVIGSSNYAITYPTVGGALVSLVDFTADQGTKAITVDVRGLTVKSDGTGGLIKNPARLRQHWLTNFVFNNWTQGEWLGSDTAPLDLESYARVADFLASFDHESSKRWAGNQAISVASADTEWLDSYGCKAWWTLEGKYALGLLRPDAEAYPEGDPVELDTDDMGEFAVQYDASILSDGIALSYLFDSSTEEFKQDLAVSDLGGKKVSTNRERGTRTTKFMFDYSKSKT